MNGPMFVSRLFHCPTCDKLYYTPMRPDMPHETERICGRCWRRDMEESDDDRPPAGPVDEYPLSE